MGSFDSIFIYSIRFTPTIAFDNVSLRRKVLDEVKPDICDNIKGAVMAGNNIYAFSLGKSDAFEAQTSEYTVSIKLVKTLKVKQNPKVLLTFLNNGLRNMMRKLDYTEIGRSGKYFNRNDKKLIDGLIMFNGYKSNFLLLENGYYLRVDSAKKIVRNQNVLQFIDEFIKFNQDKDKDTRRQLLQGELFGKIVMTNYGKAVYHKIQEVIFQDVTSIRLENNSTLCQYYLTKYNVTIKNLKQPLLRVPGRKKDSPAILLVPELCLMTGIPDNFDEFRRKKISEQTIKPAEEKQRDILKLMAELKGNDEWNALAEMGIKVSRKLQSIRGKIIPLPYISLGQQNRVEAGKQANFNLYAKPIYASKHSIRLGVIYSSGFDPQPLLNIFERTYPNLKVKFDTVKLSIKNSDPKDQIEPIKSMIKKAAEREGCNIILIIIPSNMRNQYGKIKKIALIDYKLVCQITTQSTLLKKNLQSVGTKLLLQIIAKRGNTLWVPQAPTSLGTTMMVAYENAPISGGRQLLSICATISSTYSSIYSKTLPYQGLEGRFSPMVTLFLGAIGSYIARNKEPPKESFIFQSGAAGDQAFLFIEHFVNPLRKHLDDTYGEKSPRLTFVMVNTKTSERFFTEESLVKNVPAGTLISTGIVSNYYDFYIVSQNSNRGSTVPNHYRVIYSDSKVEEGVLQELIFSQCFNYVNWTGSIKVPGILQYADKCARFNAQVLETKEICDDLQNKLYFV